MLAIIEIVVKAISKMKCFSGKKKTSDNMINRFEVIDSKMQKIEENMDKFYEKETVDQKIEALKENYESRFKNIEDTLDNQTDHLKEQIDLKLENIKNVSNMQLKLIEDRNSVQLETIKNEISQLKSSQNDINKNILNISNKLSVLTGYIEHSSQMSHNIPSHNFPPRSFMIND